MFKKDIKKENIFLELQQNTSLKVFFDTVRHDLKYKHFDSDNYFLYEMDIRVVEIKRIFGLFCIYGKGLMS